MSQHEVYEAGDDITLRLHVVPDDEVPTDGTTSVTVLVRNDAGEVRTPTATPDTSVRDHWSAVLSAVGAGAWDVVWTVTGTGAGVQTFPLLVAASTAPLGRVYATTAQLAAYTGEAPPAGARRLLVRASRAVDDLLRCAVYAVDTLGRPTDLAVAAALAEATCAQVVWWDEVGDAGTGAVAALAGAQIGSVKLPGGGPGGGLPVYAPDAEQALRQAGLLNRAPRVVGAEGLVWR